MPRAALIKALGAAARNGTSFGAPSPLEVELGERVRALMPSLERVRFVSSGTEAAMSALRVARAATGRDRIVKFEGCYHGHADAFLVKAGSGALTLGTPTSPGVTRGTSADTLVASYNDLASVRRLFDAHRQQIAARHRRADRGQHRRRAARRRIPAGLREITSGAGALLIFDEVISGFRAAPGGAQGLMGVSPDLTCLGKIIGGGLPVGAYGGRADLMELVSPAGPVYQAGTLSGNPLAMTAGLWCLKNLSPKLYRSLAALGARLAAGLADAAREHGVALQVNAFGSILTPFFTDRPVRDYASATSANTEQLRALLSRHARSRRLPAAVTVRSVVPVRRAHRERHRPHDSRGPSAMRERSRQAAAGRQDTEVDLPPPAVQPACRSALSVSGASMPDAQHGARRQIDVLALGRGDGAAAADEDAGERAFAAAENRAEDAADARANPDLFLLAHDPFALERLRHGGANRIGAAVDRDAIEGDRQAPLRSVRVASLTELTTPRITDPAGTMTRPRSSRRSTIVVASKRSSTCEVLELSGFCRRTSNSVPTGISFGFCGRGAAPPGSGCRWETARGRDNRRWRRDDRRRPCRLRSAASRRGRRCAHGCRCCRCDRGRRRTRGAQSVRSCAA